ncbi:MAG: diacylglycerol/lipid kinase family protein [Candidatus Krumholzibacteriia bacterium]
MRLSVIGNRHSGRGRGAKLIDAFRARAAAADIEIVVAETAGPGDGARLAREAAGSADAVGIIGGDGTVHEVVNGLMPSPVPIAILPAGTGNDFASLFGCAGTPGALIETVTKGRGVRVDVLDLGDRYCVNSAGLGFEGQVNRLSHGIRRIHGPPLYLLAVFKALSSLACPRFKLTLADGSEIGGRRLMVSIGNGNRTGGAFHLTPDARPDDGLVDVCVVDAMGWPRVLGLLPGTLRGRHVRRPEVRMLRTSGLTVETEGRHPMHVDGELVEVTPPVLDVSVLGRVLPVLCSEGHQLERIL